MKGKLILNFTFAGLTLLALTGLNTGTQKTKNNRFSEIEAGFKTIPDSIQTGVYWYWISDNISKEGVVKDLQAMKKAGINRAFIGNIGLDDVPYGTVKMLSEEWWDILHTALKTATDLNIEIGIFNSPGWSQSGGPWVKTSEAMRYLTSSEVRVKGPSKIKMILPKPAEIFQDVKTIAFPASWVEGIKLDEKNAEITAKPPLTGLEKLFDDDKKTGIVLPAKEEVEILFRTEKPFLARSISITQLEPEKLAAEATLQVKNQEGKFQELTSFQINRSNLSLNVGFDPFAPVVVSIPETRSTVFKLLVRSKTQNGGISEISVTPLPLLERYAEKTLAKMHPTPLPYWHEYQWRVQPETTDDSLVINESKVADISKNVNENGLLEWEVPEGEWIIQRTGMTPTGTKNSPASPEATGYEVDKMSRLHVASHFDGHMGEVLRRIPEADRKSFKIVVQDSYEMGGQNFTDSFINEFQQRYGYNPAPFFPVFQGRVVSNRLSSDRFLWDVRRLVADKVAYDYVGGLRDVSHKNGLHTWLENYGHWGFPGEFLMYGGQSDEISGEFWSEGELGDIENRAATSCGHIYGKTKISAESNTCAGKPFSRYPGVIKQRGDRFFAEGINNTLLHVYILQPYEDKSPGINAWFGNEFNRKNTWFSQIDVYIEYLKRTNLMLQQGLNVADVAYFIGEDAPKMTGVANPPLPVGYQFDYINAEVIEKNAFVRNGLITLPHGTQYRVLVLPELETMRPELLKKIYRLVTDGAIVAGPSPKRSPSLQNQPEADKQVLSLATELWGNVDGKNVKSRKVGKGMILNGMGLPEIFSLINCIPDCRLPDDNSIHYGHRSLKEGDIYFITNQTDKLQIVSPEFRVTGKQPELWEAATGSVRNLNSFVQNKFSTQVPLKLEPFESVFIVFRNEVKNSGYREIEKNYPEATETIGITGPWTVRFDQSMRGPENPVVFKELSDWTTSENEKIRYYSGTAVYNTSFNVKKRAVANHVFINLGKFSAMAKVFVNENYAGGLWTPPLRLDITKLIKEGDNLLRIEVVNTWVNRLVGDSRLPLEERSTWCPVNSFKPTDALQPSGLLGPVSIQFVNF